MCNTHIVSIRIGTNMDTTTVAESSDKTIRQLLDAQGIDYSTTTIFLDGDTVHAGDFDKSLNDFNIGESCTIIACQKTKNA